MSMTSTTSRAKKLSSASGTRHGSTRPTVIACMSATTARTTPALAKAASVFCFIAASCACCMGAKTCWRGLFKAVIMDEEQAENYSVEKMDISARKGPVYVTCIFCGLSVALTIMGAGFLIARSLFA
mmetsp:Transcript_139074/g.444153  ORF Transcript_139074/g.444153 Transcript_139074/m.444153 type:complete len:127 (-) Transcript_139074:37-417(-)